MVRYHISFVRKNQYDKVLPFFWFNLTTFENYINTFFKTRYMLKKPIRIVLDIFEMGGQFKRDPLVSRKIYTAFLNTQMFVTNKADPDTNTTLWSHFDDNTYIFDKMCHLYYFH